MLTKSSWYVLAVALFYTLTIGSALTGFGSAWGLPRVQQFAAASIKPVSVSPRPTPVGFAVDLGFACHGVDGSQNVGAPIVVAHGRCVGSPAPLSLMIAFAYEVEPRYISGGPDWLRGGGPVPPKFFQVDAVADDPSKATLDELKHMLQALLQDRFKLQFHREARQIPGYALLVAKNGPKLQRLPDNEGPEEPTTIAVAGRIMIRGKSTLGQFIRQLGFVPVPITDRTSLSGIFQYEFIVPQLGRRGESPAGPASDSDDLAAAISTAMEAQMGLRLQAEKVMTNVIVVDKAELPPPN